MNILLKLLRIGLSQEDRVLADKLNNSQKSLTVTGNCTISVDASEVNESIRQQGLYGKAKVIVEGEVYE